MLINPLRILVYKLFLETFYWENDKKKKKNVVDRFFFFFFIMKVVSKLFYYGLLTIVLRVSVNVTFYAINFYISDDVVIVWYISKSTIFRAFLFRSQNVKYNLL